MFSYFIVSRVLSPLHMEVLAPAASRLVCHLAESARSCAIDARVWSLARLDVEVLVTQNVRDATQARIIKGSVQAATPGADDGDWCHHRAAGTVCAGHCNCLSPGYGGPV